MLSHLLLLLYIVGFATSCPIFSNEDSRVLIVGEELWKETLPLQMGSRVYQLQGLKSNTCFTLQLKNDDSDVRMNMNRRLLNTEKLIFKTDKNLDSNQGKLNVLVTVEPAGIVAIPNSEERKHVIFNIVCDELLLGIPHKVWWVGSLVLFCLGVAFMISKFPPSYRLLRDRSTDSSNQRVSKQS